MKITQVETIRADIFLFVKVRTDEGIVGLGECGTWGHYEASAAAIARFAEYLVGKDPAEIERHWNVMLRANHYTGAAINGAVSALDIALWDIKGKALGVPIYELLGGRIRSKVRVYAWVKGRSTEELVAQAVKRKAQGFTAIGHLNPLLDDADSVHFQTHAAMVDSAVDRIARVRDAVGVDVDICLEMHRRLNPAEAVVVGRALEPFAPLFYEDPIKPASLDAMAWLADHMPLPIATGERFVNLQQFQMLLARRGVEYLRPSVGVCGGITATKKIAALAEAHDAQIVPHNPVSPVGLAACLHIAASSPNFAIQEFPIGTPEIDLREGLAGSEMLTGFPQVRDGFLDLPAGPGLGIELAEDAAERFPPRVRPIQRIAMKPHFDGSMVDH